MSLEAPRFLLRNVVPRRLGNVLWGQRQRWGPVPDTSDPTWIEWHEMSGTFYDQTQRRGLGSLVSDAGYRIMSDLDLEGRRVLEVGPGAMGHTKYWRGTPRHVDLVDIDERMIERGSAAMVELGIDHDVHLVEPGAPLPLTNSSVDVLITFYSLEHIYPLVPELSEFARVLAPGGHLIGAIPADGGFAWGLGRALTSRRWLRRNTTIDPDKLICWEHPNFADQVLRDLGTQFSNERTRVWPLRPVRLLDLNLIVSFVYRKASN